MSVDPRLTGVGVSLPVQDELPARVHVELAAAAEEFGYQATVCGEIAGPEAFALLGAIANQTSRMTLGTAIISTFTRSAALAAMGFATLDDLHPGRVFAGVGSGSATIVEGWHGGSFEHPLARARSFIGDLRAALAGERIGTPTDALATPSFRVMPTRDRDVPIVLAAMHPRMLELSGAIADGVLLAFCPVTEVAERAAVVRRGAVAAGRDPDDIAIIVSQNAYAGTHHDEVMIRLRRFILQYSVLPTHRASIEGSFPQIDAATEAWRAGDRRAALGFVTEPTVEAICAIGDGPDIIARVDDLHAAGADLVVLHTLGRAIGDTESAFETLAAIGEV